MPAVITECPTDERPSQFSLSLTETLYGNFILLPVYLFIVDSFIVSVCMVFEHLEVKKC